MAGPADHTTTQAMGDHTTTQATIPQTEKGTMISWVI